MGLYLKLRSDTSRLKICLAAILPLSLGLQLQAQTVDDGIMLNKNNLFTGVLYSHESWDHYWQGSLNRVNGNVGTVTTQTTSVYADYGITNRLNIIGQLPYVRTEASQGVLSGINGYQDITLAAKYSVVDRPITEFGSLRIIGVVAGTIPVTDYNPDFLPLSIGNQSKRISARATANFQSGWGWFVNGSAAYSWRSSVTLDRPYYFTNDQLYLTSEVDMPQVFDYTGSLGYFKHGVMTNFSFSQQRTQGGGDIRRQDAPFISNKFNYSKVGALVMVPIPVKRLRNIAFQFAYSRVLDGRNVGEATTYTTGIMYTLNFHRRSPRQ